jgi:hypothetical protein
MAWTLKFVDEVVFELMELLFFVLWRLNASTV